MNDTTFRRQQLRGMMHDIAWTRQMTAQRTVERETAIRRFGVAHPHSIEATRRMYHSAGQHRRLLRLYRAATSREERARRDAQGSDRK